MHILDLIVYLISVYLLWKILDKISNKEFTTDFGSIIGIFFVVIFSILYFGIFYANDNNWVDIFNGPDKFNIVW